MKEVTIYQTDAGQKVSRYLNVLLPGAGSGFLFKMLRKKNILVNNKKATGNEILKVGDTLQIYFSDETYEKFSTGATGERSGASEKTGKVSVTKDPVQRLSDYHKAFRELGSISVVYEDEHILILNKPAGLLSQKAKAGDLSVNEWMIGYLLSKGALTAEQLNTFIPSVCNRLDRNTSGLILCGISLQGSRFLSAILKDRSLHKFYTATVHGAVQNAFYATGIITKDKKKNISVVTDITKKILSDNTENTLITESEALFSETDKAERIATACRPIRSGKRYGEDITDLEILLLTGKSHQIRSHFKALGHPLFGDFKYETRSQRADDAKILTKGKDTHIQNLCAYRVVFPGDLPEPFQYLSAKEFKVNADMEIQRA